MLTFFSLLFVSSFSTSITCPPISYFSPLVPTPTLPSYLPHSYHHTYPRFKPLSYLHTYPPPSHPYSTLISIRALQGLCRTAYIHLQRMAKDRDTQYDTIIEVSLEKDHYRQIHMANNSFVQENGLLSRSPVTPTKSSLINPEMLELKKKSRHLQEQLWVVDKLDAHVYTYTLVRPACHGYIRFS